MKPEQIKEKYIEFVLENGSQPASIFAFCKKIKMKETDFYEHFSSFSTLENNIWTTFFKEVEIRIEKDEAFKNYSSREKILAFYYTLVEVLRENRSYILKAFEKFSKPIIINEQALSELKTCFQNWIQQILMEGTTNREIENRPYLNKQYPKLFWLQFIYLLDFWVKDNSKAFENTDTAIEKMVNTAFDLMAKSPIDSLFDLSKFMFQNRK